MYSIHSFILIYYYYCFRKTWHSKKIEPVHTYPCVTVQLPIYNEKYVIRRLLSHVTSLDYPKDRLEIQVIDDSVDETSAITSELVESYKQDGYCIDHIRRGSRTGFKAGALQFALNKARGEFVAIFDADFAPPPGFLKALMPEFENQRVGGVQARWGHINHGTSMLTRSQAIGLDNHFVMEQKLRSKMKCFINFNGTCGLWRKDAIIDAGGWQSDTLAEDLDLSYRVQLRGWKICFRDDVVVPGELPDNAYGYRIQQNRWAKGTIQVARKLLLRVLKSPFPLLTKFEAFVHLTCHINFLAMLGLAIFSLPVVYFKVMKLVPETYFILISFLTIGAFGYPFLYFLSQRETYPDYKKRVPYILGVIAYSMGLSISNTISIIEGWFNKRHVFTRTPKSGGSRRTYHPEKKTIVPVLELILGIYMFVGLVYVTINLQLVLIPFLLLYSFGFLSLGYSSLRDNIISIAPQEVLCSRENS